MVAGGGGRALKVRILGDATDLIRSTLQTERAMKRLDDQSTKSGKNWDDFSRKLKGVSGDLAKIETGVLGVGTALSLGVAGIGAASVGAIAAIGGIGAAFAAQNLAVAGEFGLLKEHLKTGMQEATAAFVPVMLDAAAKIRTTFDELKPQLTAVFDQVAPLFAGFTDNALESVRIIIDGLGGIITAGAPLFNTLSELMPLLTSSLMGTITKAAQQLSGPLASALERILPAITGLLDTIVTALGPAAGALLDGLGPIVEMLGGALGDMLVEIGPHLSTVFSTLLPSVQTLLDTLTPLLPQLADLAGTILVALATAIAPVVEALAPLLTQLIDRLKPVIDQLNPIIQDFGEEWGGQLAQNIKDITPSLLSLVDALLPIVPPLLDIIAGILVFEAQSTGAMIQFFKDLWVEIDKVLNKLRDLEGNAAWSFLTKSTGGVVGAAGGANPDAWMNMTGFGTLKKFLGFNTGGVVPGPKGKPTLAVVHGGETIYPTHNPAAMRNISEDQAGWDPWSMGNGRAGRVGDRRFATFEDGSSAELELGADGRWFNRTKREEEWAGARAAAAGLGVMANWDPAETQKLADWLRSGGAAAMSGGAGTTIVNFNGPVMGERSIQSAVRSANNQAARWGKSFSD